MRRGRRSAQDARRVGTKTALSGTGAEVAESRMDAGLQSLLFGDLLEERRELLTLVSGEARRHLLVVLAPDAADLGERPFALPGQMQRVGAPILGLFLPIDEAAPLELVDNRHQACGVHAEPERQILLAQAGRLAEEADDAGVGRLERQGSESVGKALRRVASQLGEEKRDGAAGERTGIVHDLIIYYNDYKGELIVVVPRSLFSIWIQATRAERTAYVVGALLMASGAVHAAILVATGRPWQGPVSLRKPATFGLSFGLTLMSVTWAASFLEFGRAPRVLLLGALAAVSVVETALVSLQAWRGVPSHFNVETPFDAAIARALAAGGFVLIVSIVVLTAAAFRANPALPPSLRAAVRIGFASLSASLLVGALMILKGMRLVFAGRREAAYLTGGSLKSIHAATMHVVLVLPLLAWLLSFTVWSERRRLSIVLAAAAIYALLAGFFVARTMS